VERQALSVLTSYPFPSPGLYHCGVPRDHAYAQSVALGCRIEAQMPSGLTQTRPDMYSWYLVQGRGARRWETVVGVSESDSLAGWLSGA